MLSGVSRLRQLDGAVGGLLGDVDHAGKGGEPAADLGQHEVTDDEGQFGVAGIVLPAAGRWQIDPGHTELAFIGRHFMLTKVRGRFTGLSGVIQIAREASAPQSDAAGTSAQNGRSSTQAIARATGTTCNVPSPGPCAVSAVQPCQERNTAQLFKSVSSTASGRSAASK